MIDHEQSKQQYEQDCLTTTEPWLLWEFKYTKYPWRPCTFEPGWYPKIDYRHRENDN